MFESTIKVSKGMLEGAPTYLSAIGSCWSFMNGESLNIFDIQLSLEDDLSGRMTWQFIPEGDYYRIKNKYMVEEGCEPLSWLRSNQDCEDRNIVRSSWYPQSLWKVVR